MSTRRGFLAFLGLAPAAVLAPKLMAKNGVALTTMAHPTGIPFADPPDPAGVILDDANQAPVRYLGLAQLKNEGGHYHPDPLDDEITGFAKEAFGSNPERYRWPDPPDHWYRDKDEDDEA